MTLRVLSVHIQSERDVVAARQRARQIARLCSFGDQDQVRIATAVSELARNIYSYAGSGKVHFSVEGETIPQVLTIKLEDKGPGIPHLDMVLSGRYQSPTGMGLGLVGAQRLMDRFDIATGPGQGTVVTLQKLMPKGCPLLTAKMCSDFCAQLAVLPSDNTMTEVLQQNQELLATLAELNARQDDLLQLTRELEDTNRGVVALYAELDEKADHLRRADEMKSRFLSNMSHEFRTPLSSIRALARLLLDRVDGPLTEEQEKQVSYILSSALGLTELVNDLLDLAKIEAGKVEVKASEFDVVDMFSALRGMLRPLLVGETVKLTFEEPNKLLLMFTDEAKLSQILRNFISNALKFTEEGEINVSVGPVSASGMVTFTVSDTGIGIEEHELAVIFEEFSQLENPMQRKVKGTGLGLPLCKNLATLLGGTVAVQSSKGQGSRFSVSLPQALAAKDMAEARNNETFLDLGKDERAAVLLVEDNPTVRMIYDKFLAGSEFRLLASRSVREADELWPQIEPAVVVLDIMLHGEDSWSWLTRLKRDPARRLTPVIVATEVDDARKGLSLGADAYFVKPLSKQQLLSSLRELLSAHASATGRP